MTRSAGKLARRQVPVSPRSDSQRGDRYFEKVSMARFRKRVGVEAPVVFVGGAPEVEAMRRVLGEAAGEHRAVEPDAVAAQRWRQGVEGLYHPTAGAIAENGVCADEPGDRVLVPLDYVLDLSRREAVQRIACEVELPAALAAPRVFPVRMNMEVELVAGARKRVQMAEHLVRLLLHTGTLPRVLLELAQVTRIDEEREPAGHSVGDFEQRLARLDEAALRRAVPRAEVQLVIEREDEVHRNSDKHFSTAAFCLLDGFTGP